MSPPSAQASFTRLIFIQNPLCTAPGIAQGRQHGTKGKNPCPRAAFLPIQGKQLKTVARPCILVSRASGQGDSEKGIVGASGDHDVGSGNRPPGRDLPEGAGNPAQTDPSVIQLAVNGENLGPQEFQAQTMERISDTPQCQRRLKLGHPTRVSFLQRPSACTHVRPRRGIIAILPPSRASIPVLSGLPLSGMISKISCKTLQELRHSGPQRLLEREANFSRSPNKKQTTRDKERSCFVQKHMECAFFSIFQPMQPKENKTCWPPLFPRVLVGSRTDSSEQNLREFQKQRVFPHRGWKVTTRDGKRPPDTEIRPTLTALTSTAVGTAGMRARRWLRWGVNICWQTPRGILTKERDLSAMNQPHNHPKGTSCKSTSCPSSHGVERPWRRV